MYELIFSVWYIDFFCGDDWCIVVVGYGVVVVFVVFGIDEMKGKCYFCCLLLKVG